jgi:Type ISP C-terminal specificity domain
MVHSVPMNDQDAARNYYKAVRASDLAAISGEEEAQLTTPVSNLFSALAKNNNQGTLILIRETRLDRTRPDFAALLQKGSKTMQRGFVELKAPSVSVDASRWTGRNAKQWVPENMKAVRYDQESGALTIGDGQISGVRPDVWAYSVSGMQIIPKWLGCRTRKGTGRAASSASALDKIRPEIWADEWNDELLDLIRVLTITLDRQANLANLLTRVCDGPLVSAALFPQPTDSERQPLPTAR